MTDVTKDRKYCYFISFILHRFCLYMYSEFTYIHICQLSFNCNLVTFRVMLGDHSVLELENYLRCGTWSPRSHRPSLDIFCIMITLSLLSLPLILCCLHKLLRVCLSPDHLSHMFLCAFWFITIIC